MPILPILQHPDPRLRNQAEPVTAFDADLDRLLEDLFDTMYEAPGIGLAATQVNVHKRVIVVDVSADKNLPRYFVNPVILERDGSEEMEEGCLSVPGVYETVQRASWIKLTAYDSAGQPFELESEGLLAICIQHEIDHLDGKLFVDHLSLLKQSRIRKKLKKEQRTANL